MALKRRLRRVSHSLVLTVPSQLAEMCGLRAGDIVEVEAIGRDALRVTRSPPST
jgi:antitoxin component of MazEF toxin-antitoxin module